MGIANVALVVVVARPLFGLGYSDYLDHVPLFLWCLVDWTLYISMYRPWNIVSIGFMSNLEAILNRAVCAISPMVDRWNRPRTIPDELRRLRKVC